MFGEKTSCALLESTKHSGRNLRRSTWFVWWNSAAADSHDYCAFYSKSKKRRIKSTTLRSPFVCADFEAQVVRGLATA
jgi:hypothetical protein